jgi:hypothetical protein
VSFAALALQERNSNCSASVSASRRRNGVPRSTAGGESGTRASSAFSCSRRRCSRSWAPPRPGTAPSRMRSSVAPSPSPADSDAAHTAGDDVFIDARARPDRFEIPTVPPSVARAAARCSDALAAAVGVRSVDVRNSRGSLRAPSRADGTRGSPQKRSPAARGGSGGSLVKIGAWANRICEVSRRAPACPSALRAPSGSSRRAEAF